jgi:glycosyltransferase involved in cell wall biosynthesis
MKIVHVTEDFSKNNTGITASVLEYSRAALAAGHQVEVVAAGEAPSVDMPGLVIRSGNCSWWAAHWRYWRDFDRQLGLAVGKNGVVHVHGIWMYPQFRAVSASLKHGWPVVITPHNMLGGWLWRRGWFRSTKKRVYFELVVRQVFQRANAIHALSELERSVLVKNFFPNSRVIRIPNAVDLATLDNDGVFANQRSLAGEKTILFLGRIHPVKGIELLVDAFSRVHGTGGSKLVIAGPPSDVRYMDELRSPGSYSKFGERRVFCWPSLWCSQGASAVQRMGYVFPVAFGRDEHGCS